MAEHVLVGFSGGVDSAMAALLLRERGYTVSGAMMMVRDASGHGCGHDGDVEAAEALARRIDIPLTVVDCSAPYRRLVLDMFRREYLAGRTPNPCVICNPLVKFALLPELAREEGLRFDHFATGHYARIARHPETGRRLLLRGVDHGKDQSYFLYRLSQEQLARAILPLGELFKRDVRLMAEARGVPVHDKPDSQDFYAGNYADLLGQEDRPGEIVDTSGRVLGMHRGYWHFTPGQRKGLGIAHREPLYVLWLEPASNRVVAGTRAEQSCSGCVAADLRFLLPPPAKGAVLHGKLRSTQPLKEMTITDLTSETITVRFRDALYGVAPGQSLVLYDGDTVVGGGLIKAAL